MFYWKYKGIYIALTDAEANAIVAELAGGDINEVIGWQIHRDKCREYEKKIKAYLRNLLRSDEESFRLRYHFRSYYADQAAQQFPAMLDTYGRITQLAFPGKWDDQDWHDEFAERLVYAASGPVSWVTILHRRPWGWSVPRVAAQSSFPTNTIEKLAGTVDNFVLMSSAMSTRFGPDHARMTVHS